MSRGAVERATFGECAACPIWSTASAPTCYACALEARGPDPPRCATCAQTTGGAGCRNRLCRDDDVQLDWTSTIGSLEGVLHSKVKRYKYDHKTGWARIFGRLLAAHLEVIVTYPESIGLVVAAPTYQGAGRFGHTELVVEVARHHDLAGLIWDDYRDPTIVQTGPTDRVAGEGLAARQRKARQLRDLLDVRHPDRVRGRQVIVFDDVLTTGHTLNEVARALRTAGASHVYGVVLGRTPWQ